MNWGLFLQEENSPKMKVIRVGTRKSQVSAGLSEMFCAHGITREESQRVSSQQLGDGGNGVAGCLIQ